jgi:hypothetical protein
VIKQNRKKIGFGFLVDFFVKTFRDDRFCNTCFVVRSAFDLPSLRSTRSRDKTKKAEEKLTSKFLPICLEIVFDVDFLQKYLMVFLNSPYRETPENVLNKKCQEKKNWLVVGWLWGLAIVRGGARRILFWGGLTFVRLNLILSRFLPLLCMMSS